MGIEVLVEDLGRLLAEVAAFAARVEETASILAPFLFFYFFSFNVLYI